MFSSCPVHDLGHGLALFGQGTTNSAQEDEEAAKKAWVDQTETLHNCPASNHVGMKCNIPCASGWQVTEFFNQTRPKAGAISMPKQLGDSKASNSTAAWWMPLSFPAGRSGWLVVPWLHDVDAACYDTPNAVDTHLSNTQYGFWPQRSTSHAIYVIRRIQDFAEAKGTRLSLALLDSENTFDKAQHDKLIFALRKMGFSQHYCDVIQNCYEEPTFFVKDAFGSSQIKRQSSGIRQGCPLSPYLFAIVMSCVDFEIPINSSRWVQNGRIPNLDFDMLYYADDTILFSTDNRALDEVIKLTEAISGKYGLWLNKDKCVAIQMKNDSVVHFENSDPPPKKLRQLNLSRKRD